MVKWMESRLIREEGEEGMDEQIDKQIGQLVLNIIRSANLLERLGGKYAIDAGLGSVQQYMILSMLSNNEVLTLSELRENTLVTKQAITGLIERMTKAGYIETFKDPHDKRKTCVRNTAKGGEVLEAIYPNRIDGNREAFSILNEEEIDQLDSILQKLVNHLNK